MEKGFFTSSLFHFFLSFLAHLTLYACGHHLHMRTHIHKLDVREREREREKERERERDEGGVGLSWAPTR